MIESIRKKVLKEFKTNAEYYSEIDVNRVRCEDWQIERFLTECDGDEDMAYEQLLKTLKWKRMYRMAERNDQYFPKEFYEWHELEVYGKDMEGRPLLWQTTRNMIKINDFIPLEQQFVFHRTEKLDVLAGRDGWTVVIDTAKSGLANVNLEMWKFKIDLLQYYPQGVRQIIVLDLPWILNSIMNIIVSFLPPKHRQNVIFLNRQQLADYIDPEFIPVSMGGKRAKRVYPEHIKPMSELTHLGLNEKQIEIYLKKHQMMAKRSLSVMRN